MYGQMAQGSGDVLAALTFFTPRNKMNDISKKWLCMIVPASQQLFRGIQNENHFFIRQSAAGCWLARPVRAFPLRLRQPL